MKVRFGNFLKKENGEVLYNFSKDLMRGCVYYACYAELETHKQTRIGHNTACVLFAASYLEARLNELIAEMNDGGARKGKPKYWKRIFRNQKHLTIEEKWNSIAKKYGGTTWNKSGSLFQAYEDIVTLRNELVHFKGRFAGIGSPPVRRIKALLQKFNGESDYKLDAFTISSWVHQLLTSKEIGLWIAEIIVNFSQNEKMLLSGQPSTEMEKNRWLDGWDEDVPLLCCAQIEENGKKRPINAFDICRMHIQKTKS